MAKSIAKPRVAKKFNVAHLGEQPLFSNNPEAALPLLSMIGQAQLSIDDLLGQLSRQFIEHMLVLSAQSVVGVQHKGRHTGEVRWHASQSGVVRLGQSKMQVKRPRLRTTDGEVAVPAYAALTNDANLSQRIADILVCNVSTRKYARVVHRCADELGISKSAVSRQFVKQSAQAWAQLMGRDLSQADFVAMNVDGVIVGKHHIIAAVGVDAKGSKHVLGLATGSSENAKVVKDLMRCSPSLSWVSLVSWHAALATTNVIESPNSVVRRVSGRVTNYKDAEMALRWTAAGLLDAEKSFKKLRGHADLKTLINGLHPANQKLKNAA